MKYTLTDKQSWATPHLFIFCFQEAKIFGIFFKVVLINSLLDFLKVFQSFFGGALVAILVICGLYVTGNLVKNQV